MISELEYSFFDLIYEKYSLKKRDSLKKNIEPEYIAFFDYISITLSDSKNIEEIEQTLHEKEKLFNITDNNNSIFDFFILLNQYISCLLGKTNSDISFSNDIFSEDSFFIKLYSEEKKDILVYSYILKFKLLFLFEDYNYALILSKKIIKNLKYCYSDKFLFEFYFYYTLILFEINRIFENSKVIKLIQKNFSIIENINKENFFAKILYFQREIYLNKKELNLDEFYDYINNKSDFNLEKNYFFGDRIIFHEPEEIFVDIENNINKDVNITFNPNEEIKTNKNFKKALLLDIISKNHLYNDNYNKQSLSINKAHKYYKKYNFKTKIAFLEKKYPNFIKLSKYSNFDDFIKETNEYSSYLAFDTLVKSSLSNLCDLLKSKQIFIFSDLINNFNIQDLDEDKINLSLFLYNNDKTTAVFNINNANFDPFEIIKQVLLEKKYILIDNNTKYDFYSKGYLEKHSIKNAICIPIISQNQILSIIYVENISKSILDRYNLIYFLFSNLSIAIQKETLKKGLSALDFTIKRKKETIQNLIVQRDIQLEITQKKLIESAHKSGMAEVATGVIHNIGNILNSLNISNQVILEIIEKSKISGLTKANNMLKENIDNLDNFVINNPKAKKLFEYYINLGKTLNIEFDMLKKELTTMDNKISLIKNVISSQQQHAKNPFQIEKNSLSNIVEDAISIMISTINKNNIKILRYYDNNDEIELQKTKLMNVIINLIKNASDSLEKNEINNREIKIKISKNEQNRHYVYFFDNGEGIEQENLNKVFNHGFTTKDHGFGFGLHTCANSMTEMGGKIMVESQGKNKGAKFTLIL